MPDKKEISESRNNNPLDMVPSQSTLSTKKKEALLKD